jgi:hypothetical protein
MYSLDEILERKEMILLLGIGNVSSCLSISWSYHKLLSVDNCWEILFVQMASHTSALPYCRQKRTWKAEVQELLRVLEFPNAPQKFFVFPRKPIPPRPPPTQRISYMGDTEDSDNYAAMYPNYFFKVANLNCMQARTVGLQRLFADVPYNTIEDEDDDGDVMWASSMWKSSGNLASMPRLAGLANAEWWHGTGITRCCVELLARQTDSAWLQKGQNNFVPYYLAAILGSVVMKWQPQKDKLRMVHEGALEVLVPLVNGSMSWAESRIAARAIGHICQTHIHVRVRLSIYLSLSLSRARFKPSA